MKLAELLKAQGHNSAVPFETIEDVRCDGYRRMKVTYRGSENEIIPACFEDRRSNKAGTEPDTRMRLSTENPCCS